MKRRLLNGWVLVLVALATSANSVYAQSSASTNGASTASTNTQTAWSAMEKYFAALGKNQVTNAAPFAAQVMAQGTNDWVLLRFFSWRIFADRNIRHRDRALALAAAERALQLTKEKEPTALDAYARALFENGRQEEAIRHQKRAVELCTEEAKRIEMEANLNRYVRLSKEVKR
jgi:Flp pilus assembly protein TadD